MDMVPFLNALSNEKLPVGDSQAAEAPSLQLNSDAGGRQRSNPQAFKTSWQATAVAAGLKGNSLPQTGHLLPGGNAKSVEYPPHSSTQAPATHGLFESDPTVSQIDTDESEGQLLQPSNLQGVAAVSDLSIDSRDSSIALTLERQIPNSLGNPVPSGNDKFSEAAPTRMADLGMKVRAFETGIPKVSAGHSDIFGAPGAISSRPDLESLPATNARPETRLLNLQVGQGGSFTSTAPSMSARLATKQSDVSSSLRTPVPEIALQVEKAVGAVVGSGPDVFIGQAKPTTGITQADQPVPRVFGESHANLSVSPPVAPIAHATSNHPLPNVDDGSRSNVGIQSKGQPVNSQTSQAPANSAAGQSNLASVSARSSLPGSEVELPRTTIQPDHTVRQRENLNLSAQQIRGVAQAQTVRASAALVTSNASVADSPAMVTKGSRSPAMPGSTGEVQGPVVRISAPELSIAAKQASTQFAERSASPAEKLAKADVAQVQQSSSATSSGTQTLTETIERSRLSPVFPARPGLTNELQPDSSTRGLPTSNMLAPSAAARPEIQSAAGESRLKAEPAVFADSDIDFGAGDQRLPVAELKQSAVSTVDATNERVLELNRPADGLHVRSPATISTEAALQKLQQPIAAGRDTLAPQLSERFTLMVNNQLQKAELRLNPAHLGEVSIEIDYRDEGARVSIQAASTQARELLDQALPRLRELLEQAGVKLHGAEVGSESSSNSRHAGDRDRNIGRANAQLPTDSEHQSLAEEVRSADPTPSRDRIIDTYV